jgi:hypothetical protein
MDNKEKAKFWMKKPELDFFFVHTVDECRDILLHCNVLCSQLSFTANSLTLSFGYVIVVEITFGQVQVL